jgi:hypothetical protein
LDENGPPTEHSVYRYGNNFREELLARIEDNLLDILPRDYLRNRDANYNGS